MKQVVFVLFFVVLTLSASAQQGTFAEPAGAGLDKFPIKERALNIAEQAELGLSAKKLTGPVMVHNHFRNIKRTNSGRFVLETLPPGTIVLVDKEGKVRYKADCGNRLVEVQKCSPCPAVAGATSAPRPAWTKFLEAFEQARGNMWEWLGTILGSLMPLLLFLALLGLIGCMAYLALRRQGSPQTPTEPDQAPAPTPTAPPPSNTPTPRAPARNAPPPPTVAPASSEFPPMRAVIDTMGGWNSNVTKIQIGRGIGRVQYDDNIKDGSVIVQLFKS